MLSRLQTYAELLKADPVNFIIYMACMVCVFLASLILHECAHGWMALRCGDPTAKMLGRLSLNPLRHLDPVGTLCMFLLGFGWAKPVPVNPRNFENYRRDDFLVSIAGIVTNLTLFVICSFLATVINLLIWKPGATTILEGIYEISSESLVNVFDYESFAASIAYGISFDWLEHLTDRTWLLYVQRTVLLMADVNLALALFNLLPIPPLDGFHVLNDTILKGRLQLNAEVFRIAQIGLIVLVMGTDLLDTVLNAGSELIGGSIIRVFLMMTGQM